MPFLDHLDELRSRIIKILVAVCAGALLGYAASGRGLSLLARSAGELQSLSPLETFGVRIKLSVVIGLLLALPFVLIQIWRFVAPGLYRNEQRIAMGLIVSSTLCFVVGGAFSFLVVGPNAMRMLADFSPPEIANRWSVAKYVAFVLNLMLAFGAIFEMPVAMFFLTKLGIVTPRLLRKKWRHAMVIIFILAAIVTPPDVFTQVMLAIPLILLYEVGILASIAARPRRKTS
ncbi:twin-arginine translocase subunit TatC [Candidatus Fermentibacteria bacterium]|nr:twin-arginine translocase subunit TatC [Candidatus Fermentibacteria bacterium]